MFFWKTRRVTVAILSAAMILMSMPQAYASREVYQPSDWAKEKVSISKKAGMVSSSFDSKPYTASITRLDYCKMLIEACRIYGYPLPEDISEHPFTDTTDQAAEYAYWLGLTKGTDVGIFGGDRPLTREMAAVMLDKLRILFQTGESSTHYASKGSSDNDTGTASRGTSRSRTEFSSASGGNIDPDAMEGNEGAVITQDKGALDYTAPMKEIQAKSILDTYATDGNNVSGWAKAYMADVYTRGILSGAGGGSLNPKGDITREQAVALSLNLLAYCDTSSLRKAGVTTCVLSTPAGIYIRSGYYNEDIDLKWSSVPYASAYDINISKNDKVIYSGQVDDNKLYIDQNSRLYKSLFGNTANTTVSVTVVPLDDDGMPSVFSLTREFRVSPQPADSSNEDEDDHDSNGNAGDVVLVENADEVAATQFASSSEAKTHMTVIEVRVWKLNSAKQKISSTIKLTVNNAVAENVKRIFEDIYNGDEKFPIYSASCYDYRNGKSQHSNGTAIDINPNENYYVTWDGVAKTSGFYKPGENVYSIPAGGDVVRAFNRNGWKWSPDMRWPNGADYMHFSLNGR